MAGRYDSPPFSLTVPLLVAAALAVALALFARRLAAPSAARTAGLVASASATTVAAIPLLLTAGYAAWPLIQATANGLCGRAVVPDFANADNVWALLALVGVGAILFIGWCLGGLLRARRQMVAALALAVVILAVPVAPSIGVIVTLYLLLGAAALISLLLAQSPEPTSAPAKAPETGRFSPTALLHMLVAAAALRPTLLSLLERRWAFFTLLVPTLVAFALPMRY